MADFNLFRRTVTNSNGKPVKRWYYWYYDEYQKQIKKSCKGCENKAQAEAYIATLPALRKTTNTSITKIAKTMYVPGSDHCKRREQFGKSNKLITLQESRRYIEKIIEDFGDRDIVSLTDKDIHSYLFTKKLSGSWKNRYLEILTEIYEEAKWYDVSVPMPTFTRYSRNTKKASILNTAEIQLLFQPENFSSEMLYTFFLVCLSAGLRSGEARALRKKQYIASKQVIIVDGFLDQKGNRIEYNKKGSEENPRFRVSLIPEITAQILDAYLEKFPVTESDYIFQMDNKPVRREYLGSTFLRAIKKVKLFSDKRKLVPHSLRYTYVTRMRRLVDLYPSGA